MARYSERANGVRKSGNSPDTHRIRSKPLSLLSGHPVAVAGRIGDYKKLGIYASLIANVMRFARCDLGTLTGPQHKLAPPDLDR